MSDPRDEFFEPVASARVTARVIAEEPGIVAGTNAVAASSAEIGMTASSQLANGTSVKASSVQLGDIEALADIGIDAVDIGRPIVDAPLLDMRLDVVEAQS